MLLGQELKFKNKLCNLKLGTFFSALPGHSPWVFMSPRLAPCRGKSFIWRPKYDIQAEKNRRKNDVYGFFFVLLYAIKEMQDLWNLDS